MVRWFGKSWGAPCCAEDEHAPTPIGEPCARCREPVLLGHQGLIVPAFSLEKGPHAIAYHLDCYLQSVLRHGPDCSRCRGKEMHEHEPDCAYRSRGERCDCLPPLLGPAQTPGP